MDPKGPSPTDGVTGLPRTRGDGPRFTAQIFVRETAPPHPRGWTPGPRTSYRARSGLPRTRGDGPPARELRIVLDQGSPAPAGRDRRCRASPHRASSPPRPSADGPLTNGRRGTHRRPPPDPRAGHTTQRTERPTS